MNNEEGDIGKNIGAILFVILISLFAFAFDGQSNNGASGSASFPLQPDLATGYYARHPDAVIFDTPNLPVAVKDCGGSFYSPDLNLFNLQFTLLYYNRRIVQNIILVQKTRLATEPFLVWKVFPHLASREKADPPVLS